MAWPRKGRASFSVFNLFLRRSNGFWLDSVRFSVFPRRSSGFLQLPQLLHSSCTSCRAPAAAARAELLHSRPSSLPPVLPPARPPSCPSSLPPVLPPAPAARQNLLDITRNPLYLRRNPLNLTEADQNPLYLRRNPLNPLEWLGPERAERVLVGLVGFFEDLMGFG